MVAEAVSLKRPSGASDLSGLANDGMSAQGLSRFVNNPLAVTCVSFINLFYLGLTSLSTHCPGFVMMGSFKGRETSIYQLVKIKVNCWVSVSNTLSYFSFFYCMFRGRLLQIFPSFHFTAIVIRYSMFMVRM